MYAKVEGKERLVLTYFHLRKIIGILAISLPFILLIGDPLFFSNYEIQQSISHYYYTGMGDVFVGILFAFGIFLFSYKGHEPQDDIAGDLACLFAVGVALFPTEPDVLSHASDVYKGYVHATSAALFFLTLSYFSLCLFTKTDENKPPSPQKKIRNRIYRRCAYTMLGCMGLVIIYFLLPQSMQDMLEKFKPIFILESSMIVAFGISWFTKGRGMYDDEPSESAEANA